jgi:integrase
MALDVTRVTVLGGSRKRVTTRDRRGVVTERYEVRWRALLHSGESRMFRQRFDRAADADQFVSRLRAVGLPASGWHLDDDGRPSDEAIVAAPTTENLTVWAALQMYRSATWRGASANGRKAAVFTLRTTARVLKPNAPALPAATRAYLDQIAFRAADEPTDASAHVEKLEYHGEVFGVADLLAGRRFLERWSLPVADLERDRVRRLIAELGHGRAAATEGRRWTQLRAVLRWWHVEGITTADLTTRLGVIRGTSIPTLGDDEPVPDEREMWAMAWALYLIGRPQYTALPLVMGGAGLRIGECCELRRRDCTDGPNSGMWISVRGTLATPGRSWTDSGDGIERRGTKAKGPDGDLRGRRTYLQAAEASVLRTHLEQFCGGPADARVFTSTTGRHLDVSDLQQRAWKRARELAFPEGHRLRNVGRHAFRHLAVTRWLRAGVPLRTAARWGGWSDVATMLRWYESRLPGDDELAAGRLAASVGEHAFR